MNVFGELARAQLEILTSDPSPGLEGRIWFNNVSNLVKIDVDGTNIMSVALFTSAGTLTAVSTASDIGTTVNPFRNLFLSGYIEIANGTKSAPTIRGAGTSSDSGFYFKAAHQPCIAAGGVDVFRVQSDGSIDCGVGAEDDDFGTGTSQTDFNYRGLTLRCATIAPASTVIIASKNYSTASDGHACVEAKTVAGDAFLFLTKNDTLNLSLGIDVSDSGSWIFAENFGFDGSPTIRARMDGSTKSWRFGTATNITMDHSFIGASLRVENASTAGGPALQLRSLNTAVGSGASLGDLQWYSSDSTSGGTGVQADIRAIETGGTGVNYYLSFRTGTATVLGEALRLLPTGRALFNIGDTAAPGIAAISDPNTGLQFGNSDDLYLIGGGVVLLQALPASIRFNKPLWSSVNGSTSSSLDMAHAADPDTGFVYGQSNDIYMVCGQNVRLTVNSAGVAFNGATPAIRPDYTVANPSTSRSFDGTSSTASQLSAALGTLVGDLIAIGLLQ